METIDTISQKEFNFIKNIDTDNYLDNINDDDPIYRKLLELDVINEPGKTKQFIYNSVKKFTVTENEVEDADKIEFYKFIFCLHVNFIKILEKENNLPGLINILNKCGLFDFPELEQQASSLQNFAYVASINFNEQNNVLLNNFILRLCKDNNNNVEKIINGYVFGYLSKGKDVSALMNFIDVLIKNNPEEIFKIIKCFVKGYLTEKQDIIDINNIISVLVKQQEKNPNNVSCIVDVFIQNCLVKNVNVQNICSVISGLINNNPNNAFYIVNGLAKGRLI